MSGTLTGISHDAWAASVHSGSALPQPPSRWTVRRKAAIVEAVRGGRAPIEEICVRYQISVDEFLAWERDLDLYGVPGLRTTRLQIYRGTK
jgi:hypothetical protein